MKAISYEMLEKFSASYETDTQAHTLHAALAKTDLQDLAYLPEKAALLKGPFTIEVKTRGITAQRKSGRCWCFAALNILRETVAERIKVPEFRLSANYMTFFDKLEKANNFLEEIIANADKPVTDWMMEYLLVKGLSDGGYWDQAVDLIQKYGAVPDYVMPETFQAENTANLLKILNILLRKDAAILRKRIAAGEDVSALKEEMLGEVYKALCIAFGAPTREFDFTYRDEDGTYHVDRHLTPKTFYDKYIQTDLSEYVTVTNEPTSRVPLGRTYTFHFFGNMTEGDCMAMNLPMEEFKELVLLQLKDQEPVWFACDAGRFGDRQLGIWDPDSFDFGGLLGGVDLNFSKEDRLDTGDTHGTHAMILVGVNLDENGRPDRWKIENSWGSDVGDKGYFVCSDRYFNEYVVEAIINKKYLTERQKEILASEPIRINPWQAY